MLKVLLVVLLIALAVWALVRVALRRLDGPSGAPPRVVGPDDDPDFLRGLDRRRRDPEDD